MDSDSSEERNSYKTLCFIIGIVMIGVGLSITCLIGYTAFQIIETPQEVELIKYVFEHIPQNTNELVINVAANDVSSGQGQTQTFTLPKEITIFGVALLALMAFRVVASVAVMTTKYGADILRDK